jgi:hypothetical protein
MLQITPQMKILVAAEPADYRRGIDGLATLCKSSLREDPFAVRGDSLRLSEPAGHEHQGVGL